MESWTRVRLEGIERIKDPAEEYPGFSKAEGKILAPLHQMPFESVPTLGVTDR